MLGISVLHALSDAVASFAGYKVMQWERVNWDSPNETYLNPIKYPELSLATTGTHDTEALTTWWREQPISEWLRHAIERHAGEEERQAKYVEKKKTRKTAAGTR